MNAPLPMFSSENEQCVIGALLLDNDAIDFVGDLKPEHFYVEDHRLLYTTIRQMLLANKPCDAVTLAEELIERDDGEKWLAFIGDMVANTPSAKHIARYAQIVVDRATERALVAASDEIQSIAFGQLPTEEKVDKASGLVMALADKATPSEGRHIGSIIIDVVERIEAGVRGEVVRKLSPWKDIDRRADLRTPGDLIIVAGRPSMGKTTFAFNLAEHVAQDEPVVVFSQEMSQQQLGLKLIAAIGRIEFNKLKRDYDKLTDDDFSRMAMALGKIPDLRLHIDDKPARTLHQVRAYARAVKRKEGALGMILIDYLQLMSAEGDNRNEQIATISRGLKAIAKELETPVVALSQLNRSLENRPNKRPIMADLRESGQIEQDADVIAFIYRDEVYHPDSPDAGTAEIIFGKLREGLIGTDRLMFNGQFSRFENLAPEWERGPTPESTATTGRRPFNE